MRPLVVYFLLVVMLVVTVMAIEINPTDIGPDPDEIDLSRFKSVYQLSIFRAYTTERNQLVSQPLKRKPTFLDSRGKRCVTAFKNNPSLIG